MSAPSKLRASLKGGAYVEVRMLMYHDMENGRRKDEAGNIVPAWHIAEFRVQHQGRTVLEGQFGTSVSKNPYLVFRFRGGNKGDKLSLFWQDNRGDSRVDDAVID